MFSRPSSFSERTPAGAGVLSLWERNGPFPQKGGQGAFRPLAETPAPARGALSSSPLRSPARCTGRRIAGTSLLEILVYVATLGIIAVLALPPLLNWVAGLRVELAAAEIAGALQMARLYAVRHTANVAVKFRTGPNGEVTYALYRDGDGDGVRNRDIERGIDPLERAPRRLAHLSRDIRFGFPAGKPPRDPGDPRRRMTRLDDPIRFNRSDLASFTSRGTATPGTVYLTDGRHHLAAARVNSRAGRVSVLRYDPRREVWRR